MRTTEFLYISNSQKLPHLSSMVYTALMLNIVMETKQQEHYDISPVELQSGCLAVLCRYRQLFRNRGCQSGTSNSLKTKHQSGLVSLQVPTTPEGVRVPFLPRNVHACPVSNWMVHIRMRNHLRLSGLVH
jgi:hypothetical protein